MQYPELVLICSTCAALAGPAAAQSVPFEGGGRFQLGIAADEDRTGPYLFGDAKLRFPLFGSNFDAEVGLFGLAFDTGAADTPVTPHETYASLGYSFGSTRLSFGVPRPAYDDRAISPLERLFPAVGLSEARVAATRSQMTWGAMYGGYVPYGAKAEGASGAVDWSISTHRYEDVRATSAGIGWQSGRTGVAAAVEWVSEGDEDTLGGKLQLSQEFGALTAGASAYRSTVPDIGSLTEGFLTWQANDRLAVSALVQVPSGEGDSLAVLAGEWTFRSGARITAGITESDGAAAASVGYDVSF